MQIKLYNLRKNEKHLTQKELAEMLGISVKSYRDKELGHQQFTQDEMFKLADIFNTNLEDIFLPRKYQNGTKNIGRR